MVERCKLQWYGHVSCSLGLAKTILQGTVNGGRRQGKNTHISCLNITSQRCHWLCQFYQSEITSPRRKFSTLSATTLLLPDEITLPLNNFWTLSVTMTVLPYDVTSTRVKLLNVVTNHDKVFHSEIALPQRNFSIASVTTPVLLYLTDILSGVIVRMWMFLCVCVWVDNIWSLSFWW